MLQNATTQALIAQMLEAQRRAAPAEEAKPKAEQAPKGKAPPLAKPKSKPKAQPQVPHPPSPPSPPLDARKRGGGGGPRGGGGGGGGGAGELKGFLGSRAACSRPRQGQRPKSRPGRQNWPAAGRRERRRRGSAGGEANLRKAKAKVAEKEEAIEGFHRAVTRNERELAAVVARVKDEEVHKVVEVDVEGGMGGGNREGGGDEGGGGGAGKGGRGVSQWLRGLMGSRDAGAI